ncbi:MAG: ABC transporter ATP-binding protein [Methanoregulaceae archaeon]
MIGRPFSRKGSCGCSQDNLLQISDLSVRFDSHSEVVRALDSVDLGLPQGEHLALIGESGCGKTVLAQAVLGLLPANTRICGRIEYQGKNLLALREDDLRKIRGRAIAMIPQSSAQVLNPVETMGDQVAEVLISHHILPPDAARRETIHLLGEMGFENPESVYQRYPHEISGGMRERALIAMALSGNPEMIVADEPTAGLDVLVRGKVLEMLAERTRDRTLLVITHDLATASTLCRKVAVMYAGEIIESGTLRDVLDFPGHPYTEGLLSSQPSRGLQSIPGISPLPSTLPDGCRFASRCPRATCNCRKNHPELMRTSGDHEVRCRCND